MLVCARISVFFEPLGAGLLELLGSCGKDLGCFFVFFIRFLVFIQPVLSNVGECCGLGGWGGGGRGALHMLCKVSLLPLLVSTFACNFFKLKRASRSRAKTGFFVGSKSMAGVVF